MSILPPAIRLDAIEWLQELTFQEFDSPEDLAEHLATLSDLQLVRAIDRHFEGGFREFTRTIAPIA